MNNGETNNIKVSGQSRIVREQVIELNLNQYDIAEDVDTVKLVVRPMNGRPRSLVIPREMFTGYKM